MQPIFHPAIINCCLRVWIPYYGTEAQAPVGGICDVFLKIPGAHHAFNYVMSPRAIAHGQAVVAFLDNLYAKTKDIPLHCPSDLAPAQIAELADAAAAAATTATARL
ncbi:hypothetical protein PC117_g8113 [Phytophthora cactorum]|uniref:Alpha/Beta hydrolase fold n=1 Tax=Phytophthora cactorum TaxID=29920 RepID=A0A8T1E422_9STRA|nr:hypothetical protein PC117_g8113 [Phytophthora cactorum]KAG4058098.1 hypothetical protein PC123_g6927 [Phytophthora cactorum]